MGLEPTTQGVLHNCTTAGSATGVATDRLGTSHAMMSTPAADMADRQQQNVNVYPYRPMSGSVGEEMLRAFTPTGRHNRRGRGRGDTVRPLASAAASTSGPTRPKKGKYCLAHYSAVHCSAGVITM